MTTPRVTPPVEEEGVEVEGTVEGAGLVVSTRGHFGQSWASLHPINLAFMAPMVV